MKRTIIAGLALLCLAAPAASHPSTPFDNRGQCEASKAQWNTLDRQNYERFLPLLDRLGYEVADADDMQRFLLDHFWCEYDPQADAWYIRNDLF